MNIDLVNCDRCGSPSEFQLQLAKNGYGPGLARCAGDDHCIQTQWLYLGGEDPRPALARQWNRTAKQTQEIE